MNKVYKTEGTCSSHIEIEIEEGVIKEVAFWGGCSGNLQALSRLLKGRPVAEALERLEGIRCGRRPTSCADQLCKALHEMGY